PLNLALVIDRSGSMSGHPLAMARKAAQIGIHKLEAQDRVSVVTFDNEVEVLIPSQFVHDKAALCRLIEGITEGGSTALHAGWLDGARTPVLVQLPLDTFTRLRAAWGLPQR
ncbi:MAG: VWA domain-containing protein, partial [Proteobacteria bacterium]|nr:VWA domain-containing protein [Pseudomonadota bacterium]